MKTLILLSLLFLLCEPQLSAQSTTTDSTAIKPVQQSQPADDAVKPESPEPNAPQENSGTIRIPAGTPIEVESAYTVKSVDVKPGELLSFRVLIPITVGGKVVIDTGALVTARVTVAKRGGHWGKAGRLSWSMQDVIAIDNTRIPLSPETSVRNPDWLLMEQKRTKKGSATGQSTVKGTSHGREVATRTIVAAAIFPPLAPLALMHGFKRGGNAILPEGKRFVVVVKNEASVNVKPDVSKEIP